MLTDKALIAVLGSFAVLAASPSMADTLEQEALSYATPWLSKLIAKCDGSYFIKRVYPKPGAFIIYQVKGIPALTVKAHPLDASARRSGIEWRGVAVYRFNAKLIRALGAQEWIPRNTDVLYPIADPTIKIERRNGAWGMSTTSADWTTDQRYGSVTCQEIALGKPSLPIVAAPE